MDSKRDFSTGKFAISEAFHKSIVRVESDDQKGSGVLAKHGTLGQVLITVDHVVIPGAVAYIGGQKISLVDLKTCYSGPNVMFILDELFDAPFENAPLILTNQKLKIGEKVYFGGYPFKKIDVRLHSGRISSIGKNGEFSIDGAAVPGMSGGPVAVEREGKLYVVGTIGSETFDPIEGFSKALNSMYLAESDKQIRYDWADEYSKSTLEEMQNMPAFTKIQKDSLHIANLDAQRMKDPTFFEKIWEDLNKQGIISDDGNIDHTKIISGQLGLRREFQQYEADVIGLLRARTRIMSMDPSQVNLPFDFEEPTDSVNTVSLSLVQSLSTGLITGHLFQEFHELVISSHEEEPTEFTIGKKKEFAKTIKQLETDAKRIRAEAIKTGTFVNTGLPPIIYRFVSSEDAKVIKKDGIVHRGTEFDEIPFLSEPNTSIAGDVGAVSMDSMVAIFPDLIPNISEGNVRRVRERKGVVTFRINVSIPIVAIKIASV